MIASVSRAPIASSITMYDTIATTRTMTHSHNTSDIIPNCIMLNITIDVDITITK